MADKTDTEITIAGRKYTLSGVASEEYLKQVADYLNRKIHEMSDDMSYWKLNGEMKTLMLQLNLADDYFKEKERADEAQKAIDDAKRERDEAIAGKKELEDMLTEYIKKLRVSAKQRDADLQQLRRLISGSGRL